MKLMKRMERLIEFEDDNINVLQGKQYTIHLL